MRMHTSKNRIYTRQILIRSKCKFTTDNMEWNITYFIIIHTRVRATIYRKAVGWLYVPRDFGVARVRPRSLLVRWDLFLFLFWRTTTANPKYVRAFVMTTPECLNDFMVNVFCITHYVCVHIYTHTRTHTHARTHIFTCGRPNIRSTIFSLFSECIYIY